MPGSFVDDVSDRERDDDNRVIRNVRALMADLREQSMNAVCSCHFCRSMANRLRTWSDSDRY